MQAEAAEAQSLQDADLIEQMQTALNQLNNPKIKVWPDAHKDPSADSSPVMNAPQSAASVRAQAAATDKHATQVKGNALQSDEAGAHAHELEAKMKLLQDQLRKVSTEVANLRSAHDGILTARLSELELRQVALSSDVTNSVQASRVANDELLQELTGAKEACLQQSAGVAALKQHLTIKVRENTSGHPVGAGRMVDSLVDILH